MAAFYSERGYHVLSVVFGEEFTEISFIEEHDDSDDVKDVKQRLIRPNLFQEEVEDIMDSVEELLDRAAIHRRNPAGKFTR